MNSRDNFGLDSSTIKKIRLIFANYSSIEKVILYGSRAIGNYRSGSDIDLTLLAPQLTTSDLLRIENELDDLLLPYQIDLSLYHQIENDDLLEHIQRVGVEFK